MTIVRITAFNAENLFNRYAILDEPWENRSYEKVIAAIDVASIASRQGDLVSYETTHLQRNNTAQAILDAEPDVLMLCEVENLYSLRVFNEKYLDHYFDRMILIDGNDPRGIDVGVLVRSGFRAEITAIRSHVDDATDAKKPVVRSSTRGFGYMVRNAIFSRDCLEVDLTIGSVSLTLMANHFKAQDGRESSVERRQRQAAKVAEYVVEAEKSGRLPIVLGDLNVPPQKDGSLDPLLKLKSLQNPVSSLGEKEGWTHYYAARREVSQLDYIMPHKSLDVVKTEIVRSGLTTKCKQYTGPRYPTIGPEHTEASDHCPVTVALKL